MDKRIISEGGRFLSDILDTKDILKTKGWPLAADIEKVLILLTVNFELLC